MNREINRSIVASSFEVRFADFAAVNWAQWFWTGSRSMGAISWMNRSPKSVMGRCIVRCEFLISFFFWRIGKNFNLDFVENREIFHTMEIIILEGRCNRFFFHFAILLYRLMVTRSGKVFINLEFFRTTDWIYKRVLLGAKRAINWATFTPCDLVEARNKRGSFCSLL